jgi:protein-S-isoprenylcysteine O-methyltransferase Ste14
MFAIRIYYQRKIRSERDVTTETGNRWHLLPGAFAALITFFFGFAYILFPSALPWSYFNIPDWLRWVGFAMLVSGIGLLWSSHHHLGKSFHSLVVQKTNQEFVKTGPYHYVRHPIYTAYVLNYVGGGLLAASWVLTFLPALLFMLMISLRIGEEEIAMEDQFGQCYLEYMNKTPRFLPWAPIPNIRSADHWADKN